MNKPKTKVILCTVEQSEQPEQAKSKFDVTTPGTCGRFFSSYRVIQHGMRAMFHGHEVYVADRLGDGALLASLQLGAQTQIPPR